MRGVHFVVSDRAYLTFLVYLFRFRDMVGRPHGKAIFQRVDGNVDHWFGGKEAEARVASAEAGGKRAYSTCSAFSFRMALAGGVSPFLVCFRLTPPVLSQAWYEGIAKSENASRLPNRVTL